MLKGKNVSGFWHCICLNFELCNVTVVQYKISQLPSKLHFSANCSFFGQSFSLGHYIPIHQPPKGVYLLSIILDKFKGVGVGLGIPNTNNS